MYKPQSLSSAAPKYVAKMETALEPYTPAQIANIEARVDFEFFVPWRRDWAMIAVKSS